jgi:hypothetical protein
VKDAVLPSSGSIQTKELAACLENALAESGRESCRIEYLERKPFAYHSSFPLEELTATMVDGRRLSLLFKNLSWHALPASVQRAKPAFLYEPLREIEVYRTILDFDDLGTPVYYGAVCDERSGHYGLFLEIVGGDELHEIGELTVWETAARWLAGLHSVGPLNRLDETAPHLLRHDGTYYRRWIERACQFTAGRTIAQRNALEHLAARYEGVVEALLAMPVSFIHGEYYAANVLIRQDSGRVCPVDWEMAAIGPSLLDVASLVAGNWSDSERRAMAAAYHSAWAANGSTCLAFDDMLVSLDVCRLHFAVQWLGWASDWTPPSQQRHDWLSEAIQLADKRKV